LGVDLRVDLGVDFEVGFVQPSEITDAPTELTYMTQTL
jgi:hypothetical protein